MGRCRLKKWDPGGKKSLFIYYFLKRFFAPGGNGLALTKQEKYFFFKRFDRSNCNYRGGRGVIIPKGREKEDWIFSAVPRTKLMFRIKFAPSGNQPLT
jgi:hypothetical protein